MNDFEVSFLDYFQTAARFYISLIRYKVGNFLDPTPKRKRNELGDKWLERISIAQAQRYVNYHRDYTVRGAAWMYRSNLENSGKEGRDLKKALKVSAILALNKFDEYQRRLNQRVFDEKYR